MKKTIVVIVFSTFNLSNVIFLVNSIFKCKTKIVLFGRFFGWNLTKLLCCGTSHEHPQIFRNTKIHSKVKALKFGTKSTLIGYFGLEFKKANILFEISLLEFANMQCFIQKLKKNKLRTKNTLFRYFWAAI